MVDGVHGNVPQTRPVPVAIALQVGALPPQPQVEAPDREQVLRPVPPAPEGPVGIRRPGNRRLAAPVRVDENHPARPGQGPGVPDDPALAGYWASRRRKNQPPPIGATRLRLLRQQQGRCPLCGNLLLHADRQPRSPEEWEQWASAIRKAITRHAITGTGSPADQGTAPCPRILPEAARPLPAGRHLWPAREPSGTCLSRGAGKPRKPGYEGAGVQ